MINKTDIHNLLKRLDLEYNGCHDADLQIYYAKLSLLEFCGWLETSMDQIVSKYISKHIHSPVNHKFIEDEIVKKTFGFHYKKHFRPMLMKCVGMGYLELIEDDLESSSGKLSILSSQLGTLWDKRCDAAHQSVAGITPNFDAPSTFVTYLNTLHPILERIEDLI